MILYIGNKLARKGFTPTSIETLGNFLRQESFEVTFSSSKKNKVLRMLDMLFSILKYRKKISFVLIDTYSTSNFYFAFFTSQLCRFLKLNYIPILRGGNLEARLQNDPKKSALVFNHAYTNIAPSLFLETVFQKYGYSKLTYIPNTIELKNYPFKLRTQIQPRLLWVRSFAEIYNPSMAIQVTKLLRNKGIDAELCMVGPEKDGSLEKTKILVPYLLHHEEDALLVEPNDVNAMVAAIEDVLNAHEKAQALSQNARKKVENFDWETVKAEWKKLLIPI